MLVFFIILFLLLSALFSGSEIAFISANKLKIELKKKRSERRGAILARFYERPSQFLGTMLVGNNVALVVFTSLMTSILTPWLSDFSESPLLLLLLNTVLITIVVLIFGEFLPKTLFRLYSEDILFFLAYPLHAIKLLLGAPAWLMTQLSNQLLKLFVNEPVEDVSNAFTRLDLENFIRESQSDQHHEVDPELFNKALNLKGTRVSDCMVPRPEIKNIDVHTSVKDLEQLFRETKLSRIIITEEDTDNVLGYVHHQQLLKEPKNIRSLIMDLPFVPEVMRVTDLMNKFIKGRINIACVVDEFGGIAGLITLEDILEEIFGEIEDEHDEEEHVEMQVSEQEFLLSGRLEIDYLNEKYEQLQFPEGEYQTLSGYLVMTQESIPRQGDEIILDGYKFILELVSDTKIETVRVIKLPEVEEGV